MKYEVRQYFDTYYEKTIGTYSTKERALDKVPFNKGKTTYRIVEVKEERDELLDKLTKRLQEIGFDGQEIKYIINPDWTDEEFDDFALDCEIDINSSMAEYRLTLNQRG